MRHSLILLSLLTIACQSKPKNQIDPQITEKYTKLGDSITQAAQVELLKNVRNAMKKGGTPHALQYCKLNASKITQALSKKYNCTIRRISFKNRNPDNQPDSKQDKNILKHFEKQNRNENKDTLTHHAGSYNYYKPIYTFMPACLKCHGTPNQDIDKTTLETIQKLYPLDKATNYKLHELRGAWKITFEQKPSI